MKNKIWVYVIVAAGFVAFGTFAWHLEPDDLTLGVFFAATGVFVLIAGFYDQMRATLSEAPPLPDLLGDVPLVLDANGLEFQVTAHEEGGRCILHIDFQNRFMGPARSTLLFESQDKKSRETIVAEFQIECPGGGVGSSSMNIGVPKSMQGQDALFRVRARTLYPRDRIGVARRFRGIIVPRLRKTTETLSIALATLIAIMVPPLHLINVVLGNNGTCRIPVALPVGVESDSMPMQSPIKITWVPKETLAANADARLEEDGNPFRSPTI